MLLKVGCSKFCEFRPDFVKLLDQISHQVCVCSYHKNVRLLLAALKEHALLSPKFSGFIAQIICTSDSKECMSSTCPDCKDTLDMFTPENCSPALQYQQWQSIDNRVDKLTITGTVGECFKELKYQSVSFLLHTSIA